MPRTATYGPPATCAHPDTPHAHGTYLMYKQDKCRCVPCSTAMSRRNKGDRLNKARGKHNPSVPATRTREHLHELKAAGVSVRQVAERTGYSKSLLERIYRGALDGTSQATQDDVLSIPVPHMRRFDKNRIDATGTRRRIRALVAMGHSLRAIAIDAGISHDVPTRISRPSNPHQWVHVDIADAIRETYNRLWDQPPAESTTREKDKATMSRNRAAANGWLPPAAWDDDQIDDPTYTPNITPLRRKSRDEAAYDRLDDLLHLLNAGIPAGEASARAGYPNVKAAYSAAHHKGLTHITAQLLEAYTQERNPAA